jgi:hypothetical protein
MLHSIELLQDENYIIELVRPEWDEDCSVGLELGLRFDMQLAVLRDLLRAYSLPDDLRTLSVT